MKRLVGFLIVAVVVGSMPLWAWAGNIQGSYVDVHVGVTKSFLPDVLKNDSSLLAWVNTEVPESEPFKDLVDRAIKSGADQMYLVSFRVDPNSEAYPVRNAWLETKNGTVIPLQDEDGSYWVEFGYLTLDELNNHHGDANCTFHVQYEGSFTDEGYDEPITFFVPQVQDSDFPTRPVVQQASPSAVSWNASGLVNEYRAETETFFAGGYIEMESGRSLNQDFSSDTGSFVWNLKNPYLKDQRFLIAIEAVRDEEGNPTPPSYTSATYTSFIGDTFYGVEEIESFILEEGKFLPGRLLVADALIKQTLAAEDSGLPDGELDQLRVARAITRLANIVLSTENEPDTLSGLLEPFGLGVGYFQEADGTYSPDYERNPDNLEIIDLSTEQPLVMETFNFPAEGPHSTAVIRDFIADSLIPAVEDSIADVQTVMDRSGFEDGFTFLLRQGQELPPDALSDVQIDSGDVALLKAGLLALKSFLQLIAAHDMNVGIVDLINFMDNDNIQGLLDAYPSFLKFVDNQQLTTAAKTTLDDAIDAYGVASELIRNDSNATLGYEELISFDPEDLQEEAVFRENLARLQSSVANDQELAWLSPNPVEGPGFKIGDMYYGVDMQANPNPFLNGQVSLRDMLPEVSGEDIVRGTVGHALGDDPTLGGIFPDMTQQEWTRAIVEEDPGFFAYGLEKERSFFADGAVSEMTYSDGSYIYGVFDNGTEARLIRKLYSDPSKTESLPLSGVVDEYTRYKPKFIIGYGEYVYVLGVWVDNTDVEETWYFETFETTSGEFWKKTGGPQFIHGVPAYESSGISDFAAAQGSGYVLVKSKDEETGNDIFQLADFRQGTPTFLPGRIAGFSSDAGFLQDAQIQGDKIYLLWNSWSQGQRLYIYDISRMFSSDSILSSHVVDLYDAIHRFTVKDGFLFGTRGWYMDAYLDIYDIRSYPIQRIAEMPLGEGFGEVAQLEIKDNYLYMMGHWDGGVVDVSDMYYPVMVGEFSVDDIRGFDVVDDSIALSSVSTDYTTQWPHDSETSVVFVTLPDSPHPINWSEYPPAVNPQSYGALLVQSNKGTMFEHEIRVVDHDRVYEGSHSVEVQYPGDEGTWRELEFQNWSGEDDIGWFIKHEFNATDVSVGTYTYRVTDNLSGEQIYYTDYLDSVEPVELPTNLRSLENGTSTVLKWDAVSGATHYWVGMTTYDGQKTDSLTETVNEPTFVVPAGFLKPGASYGFYVVAFYGNHEGFDIDRAAETQSGDYTAGDVPAAPTIFAPIWDGLYTWRSNKDAGGLTCWVKVSGGHGIDTLKRAELVFPDGQKRIPLYPEGDDEGLFEKDRFTAIPFMTEYKGPFAAGLYSIEVEDNTGSVGKLDIELKDNHILEAPKVEIPVVGDKDVSFTWSTVSGAKFYQLQFKDERAKHILWAYSFLPDATGATTMTRKVPLGLFKKGQTVKYRVKAVDDFIENRPSAWSVSSESYFMPTLTPVVQPGLNTPDVMLDREGVYLVHQGNPQTNSTDYRLGCWIGVGDLDGVPADIVNATLFDPNKARVMDLVYVEGSGSPSIGFYEGEKIVNYDDVLDGTYTIVVTDQAGRTATVTDDFTKKAMEIPVVTSPERGATIQGNNVTVTWDPVPDAAEYRIKLYYGWDIVVDRKYADGNATQLTFTGLQPGIYQYRVDAYADKVQLADENATETVDRDNFSVTTYARGAMDWFVIPPLVTAPSGDINANGYLDIGDAVAAMQIATGLAEYMILPPDTPPLQPANGDVAPFGNSDGKITIGDANILLKGVLGILDWIGQAPTPPLQQ